MADSINPVGSASHVSSSALLAARHDADARPRNRRLIKTGDEFPTASVGRLSASLSTLHASPSRDPSPMPLGHLSRDSPAKPTARSASASNRSNHTAPSAAKFLDASWSQGWASLQGLASSLLSGGSVHDAGYESDHRDGRRPGVNALKRDYSTPPRKAPKAWGPGLPATSRPGHRFVAAGSLAERDAALRAARTASVLESHEGVNGGLDVTGKYKRRTSDEVARDTKREEVQDQLVYIHHVHPTDTYAGIVLKYRCREDAFRKANGLWSRDILVRKWLAIPVDACEIKGRPCETPVQTSDGVDPLVPVLESGTADGGIGRSSDQLQHADIFSLPDSNGPASGPEKEDQEEPPWTHVRWVILDSNPKPVEIARIPTKSMGYFPPRRKKSLRTTSTLSTPRHSLDATGTGFATGFTESPEEGGKPSSRRQSSLSNRPNLPSTPGRSTPASSRSRMNSDAADTRPAWLRRPGGVGSLGKSVRAPGPEKDYFNSWAKKHLPGIALDEYLPSISVMGSETANFGFRPGSSGIVESPFDEAQDLSVLSRQGSGLDRAAATVETWLRGAFAKSPGTPTLASRGRHLGDLDLIELTDTNSDDGRFPSAAGGNSGGVNSNVLLEAIPMTLCPSARSDVAGSLRGRSPSSTTVATKGKKSD